MFILFNVAVAPRRQWSRKGVFRTIPTPPLLLATALLHPSALLQPLLHQHSAKLLLAACSSTLVPSLLPSVHVCVSSFPASLFSISEPSARAKSYIWSPLTKGEVL